MTEGTKSDYDKSSDDDTQKGSIKSRRNSVISEYRKTIYNENIMKIRRGNY